jgi:hypothetical protein
MARVNQSLPFNTRRLGEYQQSRHPGGAGKRNGRMSASELPVVTEAWASLGRGVPAPDVGRQRRYLALCVVPVFLKAD